MASETVTYECKVCGATFEGDRYDPTPPDIGPCEEGGLHMWAEETDDNV